MSEPTKFSVAVSKVWTELARDCDREGPATRKDIGGGVSDVGASAVDGGVSAGAVVADDNGDGWRGTLLAGSGVDSERSSVF